jgi:hypothetical protein
MVNQQKYLWLLTCAIAFALPAIFATECRAQKPPTLKERLLREAPKKWSEYQAFAKRLQGSSQETRYDIKGAEKVIRWDTKYEFKQFGEWSLWHREELAGLRSKNWVPGFARGVNSKYSFILQKKTKDAGWVLTELDMKLHDGRPEATVKMQEEVQEITCVLLAVEYQSLSAILKNPKFVLKDVSPVVSNGRDTVRVAFTADTPPPPASQATPRLDGWVLLDPSRCWIIQEGGFNLFYPGAIKGESTFHNEYREIREGFVIPVRSLWRFKYTELGAATSREEERATKFDYFEQDSIPEAEFSLTAFGLPEPVGISFRQATRWYLWFALAGLGAIALAYGLYTWSRRTLVPKSALDKKSENT